jgi:energy-coupling factor transporter ATP-binding protein EcfA2
VGVQKLVIDGYRGIDHFEYEPNMINVLVGRNGTGKSSILEAIAMVYTAPVGFSDRLDNNVLGELIMAERWWDLEYFVNLKRGDKRFRLTAVKGGAEINVDATYKEGGAAEVPEPIRDLVEEFLSEEESDSLSPDELRRLTSEALEGPFLFGWAEPGDVHFVIISNMLATVTTKVPGSSDLIFYAHCPRWPFTDIKWLYDLLEESGRAYRFVNYLRRHIPYFADLRSGEEELWVNFENLERPLPLSMMGDGMVEVIRQLVLVDLVPGGVLLVDGMPYNVHPAFYEVLAERLFEAALEERTQVFISTQNLEFVEKVLKTGGELVNLVRLYRIRDELAYEVLSCGEALEELDELRIDLRGP